MLFITLISYSFLVSQSFMYIIALRNVQQNMQAASYLEMRKLLDKNFRKKYSWVVYTSLITSTTSMILCSMAPESLLFISVCIAWLMLIIDIIITIKGNMPINNIINSWSMENYPSDWRDYRSKWLFYFTQRQIATTAGYISLVTGLAFS